MSKLKLLALLCTSFILVLLTYQTKAWAAGNLIGYWKFDETITGSTVADSSGNANNGTPKNAPVPSENRPPVEFSNLRSLSFNGSNQYVQFDDSDVFTLVDGTFSTWIQFNSIPGAHVSWLAKRNASNQVEYQWGWNGSALKVTLANGGSTCCTDYTYTPSPALTTSEWYHLAVTVNNTTKKLRWYQNGVFKKESDIGENAFGTNTTANLTLGSSFNGTGEFLSGFLDETRIYNRVLTDEEIEAIAEGESGTDVEEETPSPTPTPEPQEMSSPTSLSSAPSPTQCNDTSPSAAPDLFQISTSPTSATLYFTPVHPTTGYIINYGTNPEANQHAAAFGYTNGGGAVSYAINALAPGTNYYFRVQGKNNCVAGSWSQILSQTTTSTNNIVSTQQATPLPTPKRSPVPTPQAEVDNNTDNAQDGYDLSVKVVNNGQPVQGATVEVHSTPRRSTTDKDGIARFPNVEKGEHTVYLAYEGYQGQEKITVDGEDKQIDASFSIELKPSSTFFSPAAIFLIGVLVVVILWLLIMLRRKRRSKRSS